MQLFKLIPIAIGVGISFSTGLLPLIATEATIPLPSPEDIPEEILRTEIITEARSPVDGQPLTAAEYAELQAQLETGPPLRSSLSPQIREVVTLLRLRQMLRKVVPFLVP